VLQQLLLMKPQLRQALMRSAWLQEQLLRMRGRPQMLTGQMQQHPRRLSSSQQPMQTRCHRQQQQQRARMLPLLPAGVSRAAAPAALARAPPLLNYFCRAREGLQQPGGARLAAAH
jgi:hypothetical protein